MAFNRRIRVEEILEPGQRPLDAKAKNRQRATYNAHFNDEKTPLEAGNRVFIGDVKYSELFTRAVPLVTQLTRQSLLYRIFRDASGNRLPLNGIHWSSYTRSCRPICDLTEAEGRKRANILREAISKRNDFDILTDL